jgi:hypothetical protein
MVTDPDIQNALDTIGRSCTAGNVEKCLEVLMKRDERITSAV